MGGEDCPPPLVVRAKPTPTPQPPLLVVRLGQSRLGTQMELKRPHIEGQELKRLLIEGHELKRPLIDELKRPGHS